MLAYLIDSKASPTLTFYFISNFHHTFPHPDNKIDHTHALIHLICIPHIYFPFEIIKSQI